MTDTTDAPRAGGSKAAAISNLTVRLFSQYTGRGPTKARTYITDDLVTIVLQDTLTPGERTLIAHDHAGLVEQTRLAFQNVMSDELKRGVEDILQREVIAFLSANHVDPDIAIESFVLAPAAPRAAP